ncbi:hypothetical protein R3P38DRAFT_3515371 [Favolaschia claudopus]|uniref:Uncharacterized protein n=1 Tax=Favolaschia claudopus TaxID=2862362 RepID=A0AAV9Z0A3_9AGAR
MCSTINPVAPSLFASHSSTRIGAFQPLLEATDSTLYEPSIMQRCASSTSPPVDRAILTPWVPQQPFASILLHTQPRPAFLTPRPVTALALRHSPTPVFRDSDLRHQLVVGPTVRDCLEIHPISRTLRLDLPRVAEIHAFACIMTVFYATSCRSSDPYIIIPHDITALILNIVHHSYTSLCVALAACSRGQIGAFASDVDVGTIIRLTAEEPTLVSAQLYGAHISPASASQGRRWRAWMDVWVWVHDDMAVEWNGEVRIALFKQYVPQNGSPSWVSISHETSLHDLQRSAAYFVETLPALGLKQNDVVGLWCVRPTSQDPNVRGRADRKWKAGFGRGLQGH